MKHGGIPPKSQPVRPSEDDNKFVDVNCDKGVQRMSEEPSAICVGDIVDGVCIEAPKAIL